MNGQIQYIGQGLGWIERQKAKEEGGWKRYRSGIRVDRMNKVKEEGSCVGGFDSFTRICK